MNSILNRLIPFTCLTLLNVSCSTRQGNPADKPRRDHAHQDSVQAPAAELPATGIVIARYAIPKWPGESCAMYIPKRYQEGPTNVLFLLDPHAQGRVPVALYQEIADQCGIVLMGSNNAENGKSVQEISAFVQHLMSSMVPLLGADTVYTALMGFSGGARAASVMAASRRFHTVILSGAGMAPRDSMAASITHIIGIAGFGDGNFGELYRGTDSGDALYFNGGHQWPDDETVLPAFHRLIINAAQSAGHCPDETLLSGWLSQELKLADEAHGLGSAALLSFIGTTYGNCLPKGLSLLSERLSSIKQQTIAANRKLQKVLKEEQSMRPGYTSAMMQKDTVWWQKKVAVLQNQSIDTDDPSRQMSAKRQLAFLGLAAYGLCRRAMASNQPVAEHLLYVYHCIEPMNPEAPYLLAQFYSGTRQDKRAMHFLTMAAKLGFDDVERVTTDPELMRLQRDPIFNKVLQEIENNRAGRD